MAILGLFDKFNGLHGSGNIRKTVFSVEATLEGKLERDFVAGVDYDDSRKILKEVISNLEGKYLDDLMGRATVENIALYLLFHLQSTGFTSIKVTEGTDQYVTIFSNDVPEDYPIRRLFGIAASQLVRQKFQESCNSFTEVLRIKPQMAEAFNCRGRCFRHMNKPNFALIDFSSAIELQPSFGEAYRNRGNVKYDLKRFSDMLTDFDQAVKLLPNSALAFNNRGFALQHFNQYKQAIKDHKKAIEIEPTFVRAYFDLAKAYEGIGEAKLSQRCKMKAQQLPEQDPFQLEWKKVTYPK